MTSIKIKGYKIEVMRNETQTLYVNVKMKIEPYIFKVELNAI